MLNPASRRRRGFTLAEVLVAFALVAVLASVTVPAIKSRVQDGYEDTVIQEFQSLAAALTAYRQDVGKYPPNLAYLIALPTAPTDNCLNPLASTDSAKWSGPYISRSFNTTLSSYTIANRDAVQNSLTPRPFGNNLLAIRIDNLDATTETDIDVKVDGTSDRTTGTLRYTPGTPNLTYWVIPIRAGSC